MQSIEVETAENYLRQTERIDLDESVEIRELTGGVSNLVLYVARQSGREDFVLKQARAQLRVADPWFCGVERIWREIEVLQSCDRLLEGCELSVEIPRVLFEDRENFAFAMTAAPRRHTVWKQQLLDGQADEKIAAACGSLLGTLHGRSWQDAEISAQFDDRQFFDELRIDPYYRRVASVHEQLQPAIQSLIDSVWNHRCCLVHGDFSPKNLLVFDDRLMMIDFEVGHYGDPAFDLGFFLSHLVLKAFHKAPNFEPYLALTVAFWKAYRLSLAERTITQRVDDETLQELALRAVGNFAGCALARIDGKSQVEYLTDNRRRDQLRQLCFTLLQQRQATWEDVVALIRQSLG